MKTGLKRLLVAATFAISSAATGVLPSVAQTPPSDTEIKLCKEGEVWEFVFECDPVTLQCHIVEQGCVPDH